MPPIVTLPVDLSQVRRMAPEDGPLRFPWPDRTTIYVVTTIPELDGTPAWESVTALTFHVQADTVEIRAIDSNARPSDGG